MAANQLRAPSLMMGYWADVTANTQSLALNAAATWLAFQFVAEQAKTLNEVSVLLNAKAGTLSTTDMTADLFSDTNGLPGTSIESHAIGAVPAAGAWARWTGFTTALTAGTAYWIVLKNANGVPGTNFPTYQWVGTSGAGTSAMPLGAGSNFGGSAAAPLYGWNKIHSTNSGSTWTGAIHYGIAGLRLGFSDSTYDGLPASGSTRPSSGASGDRATGTQGAGVRFNVPANATLNVKGAWFPACKISTPGNLLFKLYQGTTLLATSNAIPAANIVTSVGDGYTAFFPTTQPLSSANNPYRLIMCDATTTDSSTLGYNGLLFNWDSDTNSLALKPMDGSLQETVTADYTQVTPVFTDTNTNVLAFGLLLDTAGEFTASGGGGGGAPIIGSAIVRGLGRIA